VLDNESQKLVQLVLDELQVKQPRTTLTVAHRLLTIKDCDKIAFLGDGGKQGRPDEFLGFGFDEKESAKDRCVRVRIFALLVGLTTL
jgi:hypothetical protein